MATLTTAIELIERAHQNSESHINLDSNSYSNLSKKVQSVVEVKAVEETRSTTGLIGGRQDVEDAGSSSRPTRIGDNAEFKLPSYKNLAIIIGGNALFQISFFIIVSSASLFSEHLGGTATFSGLVIGVPTVFSGLCLLVVSRYDGGQYNFPLILAYTAIFLGSILYALAYPFRFLYLILIGRIVSGFGFIGFMYCKRYCSDPRVVGVRRRTTLASLLVVGQGIGTGLGPWLGGVLYKYAGEDHGKVWNGLTSPGWVMSGVFLVFLIVGGWFFDDVPKKVDEVRTNASAVSPNTHTRASDEPANDLEPEEDTRLTLPRAFVLFTMCYSSMTCFFVLGSWEANIPVFTAHSLGYNPFQAGNFIALGGACAFPFLLVNVWWSMRRGGGIQDRTVLGVGMGTGTAGLVLLLITVLVKKISFGPTLAAWFLVALGFNLASTCTLSLLSKQFPNTALWNKRTSMAIQYANYSGRVTGAVLGGAGVKIGMKNYVGVQLGVVGLAGLMYVMGWGRLKVKLG